MKKIFNLFVLMCAVLLTTVSFSSCSDDSDEVNLSPYANTVWEYTDVYADGTITERIKFIDEKQAYSETEYRNAGGILVDISSIPYNYMASGDFIVFYPLQSGKANLEAVVTDGIKMVVTNTSDPTKFWTVYKK